MGSIILVGADNVVGNEGNSFERTLMLHNHQVVEIQMCLWKGSISTYLH